MNNSPEFRLREIQQRIEASTNAIDELRAAIEINTTKLAELSRQIAAISMGHKPAADVESMFNVGTGPVGREPAA
jgi:hypothetical protein